MPQNKIEFQHGMSLREFTDTDATKAKCEVAMERATGRRVSCAASAGKREHARLLGGGGCYWECASCRGQLMLRSGILFHASKLPLIKWFQAICPVKQNKNNFLDTDGLANFVAVGMQVAP